MDVRRRLNRALLARQWLLAPRAVAAGTAGVVGAVEHLLGLQSQNPEPPYWALATRLAGFDPADLSAAVGSRAVVRLALHRSTIHAVSARDAVALRPLLAPMLVAQVRSAGRAQLDGLDDATIAAATRDVLADGPLTLGAIGAALARTWPGRDPDMLARAARACVPLVQPPPRGVWGHSGPPVHLPLERWLPDEHADPTTPAEALVRYLAAFGPASTADAQKCFGITRLGAAATALGDRLVRVEGEDGAVLWDLAELADDADASPGPDAPAPVRLLAPFDAAVLSHTDRRRVLGELPISSIATQNGQVRGAVLLDGFTSGSWRPVTTGDALDVVLTPFRTWTPAERDGVDAAGHALLDTLRPGLPGSVRLA